MAMQGAEHKSKIWEDKWVHTACGGCYGGCAIKVHVINGVAVAIEGVDTSLGARGGVCGKGAAGLMMLYDPNRLNYPLRRTNPQKGLGVDPQWKRITWDEALSEIADRRKRCWLTTRKRCGRTVPPQPSTVAGERPAGTL